MRARASLAAAAIATGCGRLGFDPAAGGGDGAIVPPDPNCPVTLCEDFDGGAPFARWDRVLGAPSIDTALSVSPPASMRVTRAGARADGTAYLERSLPGSWAELACTYRFRFDHQDPMEIIFIVVEFAEFDRPGYGVSVHVGDGTATFFEGYDTETGRLVTNQPLAFAPPRAQWVELGVVMSPLGAGAKARVTLDGVLKAEKDLDQAATVKGAAVRLGSTYAPGTAPFDLRYDDLRCDLRRDGDDEIVGPR